jgi:hypothetical protein
MSTAREQPLHLAHLQVAHRVRLGQCAVKRAMAAHELSIEAALVDPRARGMSVYALLAAQWRWGEHRAVRALGEVGEILWGEGAPPMSPYRLVGVLSARERAAIAQACKPRRERDVSRGDNQGLPDA